MTKGDLEKINLPDKPGAYFFVDRGGEPLYIGKATSLRNRVRSYFSDDLIATRGPLLVDMVTKAHTITWQETDSVLEALILESELIKQYQPPYNSREKDDKSYWYVVITKEDFPRVFLERGSNIKQPETLSYSIKSTYGPYPQGNAIKQALKIIRKIFPFRVKKSGNKHHDRFYKQLGLVPDTETSEARQKYQRLVRHVGIFLKGKKGSVLKEIEKDMKQAARQEEFEYAAILRNRMRALQHINDVSLMKHDLLDEVGENQPRIEAYDIAHMTGKSMTGVMTVLYASTPATNEYRQFNIRSTQTSNDPLALGEVLVRRFKHTEWPLPNLIVMDGGKVQLEVAKRFMASQGLTEQIDVVSVVKDERHKPKDILGPAKVIKKYTKEAILIANSEAHRFSIKLLRQKERKRTLGK
ncbi:UvrB/UvrC motif-containing protein [Candidatus Nomurabacteria bacterium]|nr:UvrB/UvrC motif-containing protein [Candidatus Nomurabacteria bacterium]